MPGSQQMSLSHHAERSLRRVQITLNGQERVMGDVSATTSTVGSKYISWYFTVEQCLYVKMIILRGPEGVFLSTQTRIRHHRVATMGAIDGEAEKRLHTKEIVQ